MNKSTDSKKASVKPEDLRAMGMVYSEKLGEWVYPNAVTGERTTPARDNEHNEKFYAEREHIRLSAAGELGAGHLECAEIIRAVEAQRDEAVAALKNLVDRDLIKDKEGDHMDEIRAAIANAEGSK